MSDINFYNVKGDRVYVLVDKSNNRKIIETSDNYEYLTRKRRNLCRLHHDIFRFYVNTFPVKQYENKSNRKR